MVRRPHDPFGRHGHGAMRPPRQMLARFYLTVAIVLLLTGGLAAGAITLRSLQARSSAIDAAQAELAADVPALHETRLRPVRQSGDMPMADLVDASGRIIGTVTVRSPHRFYATLVRGDWNYTPATDAQVKRVLTAPPATQDESSARMVKNCVGALLLLWPAAEDHSVKLDSVDAVTATSDRATGNFAIAVRGRRIGAGIDLDLADRRVLGVELRTDIR